MTEGKKIPFELEKVIISELSVSNNAYEIAKKLGVHKSVVYRIQRQNHEVIQENRGKLR